MFTKKYPLQLRNSTQLPQQLESKLNNGYLLLSVSIQEEKVSLNPCSAEPGFSFFENTVDPDHLASEIYSCKFSQICSYVGM